MKLHPLLPICLGGGYSTGGKFTLFRSRASHELGCFVVTTGVDEVLADPAVHMFRGLGCSQMYRILTFAVGFFQTGSHSPDRRHYSGSML